MNLKNVLKEIWWFITASGTINSLADAVIITDSNGSIQRANEKAKECFGIGADETKIVNISEIIVDGMDAVKTSITKHRPTTATAKIPGREFYIELNASSKGSGYCITIRDLTELTKGIDIEDKIARFNGEKNAMLMKIEGDIKSPLTSITGFSQGLLDGLGGKLTEKQAKYIKIILENSNDLYHFMDKFLEFSYAEASLYEADYKNFDIVELLKSISKDFEPQIEEKKLSFDLDYDNFEKRTIYTDMKAIKLIYGNILEAALSMTDSGYILVKLSNPNEDMAAKLGLSAEEVYKSYLQICVIDTGSGISPDEKKYLCDPYAQLEKGKKNFVRALELGTASILTKRADGFINIKSEVMKGTRYDIVIPIEKKD